MKPPPAGYRPASRLLYAGAVVAGFYVAAQLFQELVFRFLLPPTPTAAAAVAQRLLALDRLRQVVMLASLFVAPVAYTALALSLAGRARGASIIGLLFGCVFAAFESAYRSIDLLAGHVWAAAFVSATDPAARAMLLARFAVWDEIVAALYLPLLGAHAFASAAFALALRRPNGRANPWDRALTIALAANALRAALRILQIHGGIAALGSLNSALYLPITLATYGTLALWLARQAILRSRRASDARLRRLGTRGAS